MDKILTRLEELIKDIFRLSKCSYSAYTIYKSPSHYTKQGDFYIAVHILDGMTITEDMIKVAKFLKEKKLDEYFDVYISDQPHGEKELSIRFINEYKDQAEEIITYAKIVMS